MDIAQDRDYERLQLTIAKAVNKPATKGREEYVDCELPIPVARRKANPNAIRCIDCQETYEAGTPNIKGRI